jgi:hypothetical protein
LDGGSESVVGWPFTPLLEWTKALLFNEALFTQYFFVYNHYYYRDKDVSMLSLLILAQAMLKFLLDRLFRGAHVPDNVIAEYGAGERTKCAKLPKRTFLTFLVQLHSERLFYEYIRRSDKWWYRWGWNYFGLYATFARWFNPWSFFFFTRYGRLIVLLCFVLLLFTIIYIYIYILFYIPSRFIALTPRRVNNGRYNIYFYIASSEAETRDPYLSSLEKSGTEEVSVLE